MKNYLHCSGAHWDNWAGALALHSNLKVLRLTAVQFRACVDDDEEEEDLDGLVLPDKFFNGMLLQVFFSGPFLMCL